MCVYSVLCFVRIDPQRDYCVDIDAIVFLVDMADTYRFDESKAELNALLGTKELKNVPFLILGNKIDKKVCLNK